MADALALTARPDLSGRVRSIEEEGYTYFPGALKANEVAELRAA